MEAKDILFIFATIIKLVVMEHHHHHHSASAQSLNGIFILSIILNLVFVLVEAGVGLWQDSLSLLSDAGHNLSDVFSLVLVLIACADCFPSG